MATPFMSTTFDPSKYLVKAPGTVSPLQSGGVNPNNTPSSALVTDRSSTSTIPTTTNPDPTSTAITYGFGTGGGGLTTAQQKVSDSVQNSFANSLAQRDRTMQRYQMPQLSSFTEDEALQRAIATANLANSQTNPYGITSARGSSGGGGRGGGGGGGGGYALPRTSGTGLAGPKATPWYSYLAPALQGIASVAPWLLGSDTLDQLRKKGVFGWLKDPSTGTMTPVDISGQPVGNALQNFGGQPYPINPITGMPMAPGSGWANTSPSYYGQPDFVGPPAELVGPPTDYGYSNVMGPPAPTYDVAPDNWDFTGSSSAIPDWSYWG